MSRGNYILFAVDSTGTMVKVTTKWLFRCTQDNAIVLQGVQRDSLVCRSYLETDAGYSKEHARKSLLRTLLHFMAIGTNDLENDIISVYGRPLAGSGRYSKQVIVFTA